MKIAILYVRQLGGWFNDFHGSEYAEQDVCKKYSSDFFNVKPHFECDEKICIDCVESIFPGAQKFQTWCHLCPKQNTKSAQYLFAIALGLLLNSIATIKFKLDPDALNLSSQHNERAFRTKKRKTPGFSRATRNRRKTRETYGVNWVQKWIKCAHSHLQTRKTWKVLNPKHRISS